MENVAKVNPKHCSRPWARCWSQRGGAVPRVLPVLLLPLAFAACDNRFEPVDAAGPPFSIFGYFDASEDTQWVRVDPSRRSLIASPHPAGVMVTLADLDSARVIELRDSATHFGSMIGAPVHAHNFWTAERLAPGASYRFRAQRTDGAVAESVIRIPRDYRLEVWSDSSRQYIWIEELQQLVFLISYDYCPAGPSRHVSTVDTGGNPIGRLKDAAALVAAPCTARTRTRLVVEVVGSEVAWPFGLDYSTWRLDAENLPSNITGAVGFLGGVLTRSISIERCMFAYRSDAQPYCRLRYDRESATLRGKLTGSCAIRPDSAEIVLRELAGTASDPPRIRRAWRPDQVGEFEVGALRPGVPHELMVAVGDTAWRFGVPTFQVYRDTLEFTAGQTMMYTAALVTNGTCPTR